MTIFSVVSLFLIVALLTLYIIYSQLRTVKKGNCLVIERLGRFHRTVAEGIRFIGWEIEEVRQEVNLQKQTLTLKANTVQVEGVNIKIDAFIIYGISPENLEEEKVEVDIPKEESKKFKAARNIQNPTERRTALTVLKNATKFVYTFADIEKTLSSVIQQVIRERAAQMSIETKDGIPGLVGISIQMNEEIKKAANNLLKEGGVVLYEIGIKKLTFPDDFIKSMDDRAQKTFEGEGVKIEAQAQAEAIKTMAKAEAEAQITKQEAFLAIVEESQDKGVSTSDLLELRRQEVLEKFATNGKARVILDTTPYSKTSQRSRRRPIIIEDSTELIEDDDNNE